VGCAPQKRLQSVKCMTPGAIQRVFDQFAKNICSVVLLCANLSSHVVVSIRLLA